MHPFLQVGFELAFRAAGIESSILLAPLYTSGYSALLTSQSIFNQVCRSQFRSQAVYRRVLYVYRRVRVPFVTISQNLHEWAKVIASPTQKDSFSVSSHPLPFLLGACHDAYCLKFCNVEVLHLYMYNR